MKKKSFSIKNRIFALCTMLALVFTSFNLFAQTQAPTNTISRSACLSGYIGCSNVLVSLKLMGPGVTVPISKTYTYQAGTSSYEYSATLSQIKVTIGTLTHTGAYNLPSTIGDQVVIPSTDGLTGGGRAYTISITKIASRQFTLAVSEISL